MVVAMVDGGGDSSDSNDYMYMVRTFIAIKVKVVIEKV
jgi:hypothetical protein